MNPTVLGTFALLQQSRPGAGTAILIQIVLIFAIIYFLLIRPQRKERQRHQQMVAALQKGDKIVTNGGIIGEIVHATPTELTIKTADQTRLLVVRDRVSRLGETPAE